MSVDGAAAKKYREESNICGGEGDKEIMLVVRGSHGIILKVVMVMVFDDGKV